MFRHILPLDGEGLNLYEAVKDGILLCKVKRITFLPLIMYLNFYQK